MTVDLLCLVADKNIAAAVRGLLSKPRRLGITRIDHDVIVHPERDPGCFHNGPEFLRGMRSQADHGLVVLDHAWSGVPTDSASELEGQLEHGLALVGLEGTVRAIVIEPEIEAWVFSGSSHVPKALGWKGRRSMREALNEQDLWSSDQHKPADPKRAMEWALRQARIPRSSSIYGELATRVGTKNCTDRAFIRFRRILQEWFPAPPRD